jgi:hypothetical protein
MFRIVERDTPPPDDVLVEEDCADFALSETSPAFAGADAGGVLAGVDDVGVVDATTVVVCGTTCVGVDSITFGTLDVTGVNDTGLIKLSLDALDVVVVGVAEFVAIVVGDV